MRLVAAVGVCIGLGVGCAAQAAPDRLVHRYLDVEISPNGELVASVEGDSSKSGGAPTVRDLLIRHVPGGTAITIPMPCGRVPQCWPDSPAWSPDGKRVSLCLAYTRQPCALAVRGGRRRQRLGQAVGFQRYHRALALSAGWPSCHARDSKRHQGSRRDSSRCGDRRRFGCPAAGAADCGFGTGRFAVGLAARSIRLRV